MTKRVSVVLVLCVAAMLLGSAHATTLKRATLQDLISSANHIFVGQVAATESRWVGKKILTSNSIAVSQVIKGAPGQSFTLTTLGGRVGAIAQTVPSSPRLQAGQEVLVFAGRAGGHNLVVYMNQGLFDVVAEGGKKYVLTNAQALGLPGGGNDGRIALDNFVNEIAKGL
ncbi:MAG TPA: hypothetical protein VIW92_12435 [Thermoanaerobaculia bacterium]